MTDVQKQSSRAHKRPSLNECVQRGGMPRVGRIRCTADMYANAAVWRECGGIVSTFVFHAKALKTHGLRVYLLLVIHVQPPSLHKRGKSELNKHSKIGFTVGIMFF